MPEKYDLWQIEPYLPQILVDAFEELRLGTSPETIRFRELYQEETSEDVPNITDLGASDMLSQSHAVQATLGFMMKDITGFDWLEPKIDAYCNAQKYVLQQMFDRFLRLVWRQGMYEMTEACKSRGMSGEFGETNLRTYIIAGRIMFTFAKLIDKSKGRYYKEGENLFCNENSVSFVGEDSDPLCLSAGLQSVYADFWTALNLIEDVIKHWPPTAEDRKKAYRADEKVGMI